MTPPARLAYVDVSHLLLTGQMENYIDHTVDICSHQTDEQQQRLDHHRRKPP